MTPERWRHIEELYHLARERGRAVLVDADPELRAEVEKLLAQDSGGSFLDGVAPDLLTDPTATMITPGWLLGPYRIESMLGAGGMGTVYRGVDTRLGRPVAIKISAEQFSKRFEREARAISALNHPNICTLYDVGSSPSGPGYMVTELVEGQTLREWLKQSPEVERRIEVIRQVIDALGAAHEAGIIHRDLKPANIMVRSDGYVKVLDFGLAKRIPGTGMIGAGDTATELSALGQLMGTVAYMSPEQILGQEADARSDLFALGIILYEMAAGRHPWPHKSTVDTMHAILHDDPPAIERPLVGAAAIERIAKRCLSKKPELRFQAAAEVRTALQQVVMERKLSEKQPSIAVLPFTNMTADKENEFFGDGLAEEVINALANAPGIRVAGRTSSFFFRGRDVEFDEIGRRLKVEHILEGSVRKAGNRIRVTAQLIQVADGFHLWSERYDREMTDVFAVQDEITQAIAGVLRIKLSSDAGRPPRHVPNLRAYEAYLKARDIWFNGARPELLPRFKELLERAIELDPKFALPFSFLGIYYTMQANLHLRPTHEVIPLAMEAEEAALRVDPFLAEAHALKGVCLGGYKYEWEVAERHWHLAMAHESVSRDVLFWYGNHHLLPVGRIPEAIDAMSRGLEGDPLNLFYRHLFARGLRLAGRLNEAEAELRSVLEIDENFPHALGTLGSLCAQQGRFEEALALTEKAHALIPWSNPIIGQLAALLARTDRRSEVEGWIEKLQPGSAAGAAIGLTIFYAIAGELDRAAEWAERAIEQREMQLVQNVGPFLRPTQWWPVLAKLMKLPS